MSKAEIMVFIICLYAWDYRCDTEVLESILAVYDNLEKTVEFTFSYHLEQNGCLEIQEIINDQKN